MWKNLAICLSLANLLFLNSWQELFRVRAESPQELGSVPIRAQLFGTIVNVLLVAGVLWAVLTLVERIQNRRLMVAAQCAFLILVITPLDLLGWDLFSYLGPRLNGAVPLVIWSLLLVVPILGCVLLLLYKNPVIFHGFRAVVLILTPLLPLSIANLAWASYTAPSREIVLAKPLTPVAPHRVVWMIFDEMDYRISFEVRPDSIQMPETDRLRGESLFATNAHSPAKETLQSIPSLLIDRLVRNTTFRNGRMVVDLASGEKLSLDSAPVIFSRAREAGFNAAMTGWWLPYCRTFGSSLTACAQPVLSDLVPTTVSGHMENQWRNQIDGYWLVTRLSKEAAGRSPWCGWSERKEQLNVYKYVRDKAMKMIADPSNGLVFVHWPIPHPLGIYDREKNDFGLKISNNYLDNLELTDRAIGEVREQLRKAGLAERTTLIVTSDHPLRPFTWDKFATWTDEEAEISGDKWYPLIPFIVKFPGSGQAVEYASPFNTLLTQDLILDILRGKVDSPASAAQWLDAHRTTIPVVFDDPKAAD